MAHKLLLADDSVTIQRVIELTFADEDVHVVAVGDGKKAIESIQSDRPDIVLADVGMPERDGYEVAEFVKRNPQLANIPVLLLTGAFEPIDETRARAVGCDGVLVKPFEPQMVINRVKDLLAGRRTGGLWGAKPAPPPAPERASAPAEKEPSSQPASAAASSAASASLEEYFDRLDAAFASVEAATEARSAAPAIPPPVSSPTVPFGSAAAGLSTDDFPGWDPDLTGDPQRAAAAAPELHQSVPAEPPAVQRPSPIPLVSQPRPPVAPQAAAPMPSTEIQVRPPQPTPTIPPAPAVVSAPHPVADTPVSVHAPSPAVERAAVVPHVPAVPTQPPAAPPAAAPSRGVVAVPSLADAFAALLSAEQGRRVSPSTVGSATISDDAVHEIVEKVIARMTDKVVRETVIDVAERLVREEIDRIKVGR
jgi:CheY-like chemotaxis protein